MIRKKTDPTPEIDIPLTSTASIDKNKLSAGERKRRRAAIKRFLFTFIVVTLVLIAVSIILFLYSKRDKISSRSIKTMWNSFWGIEISASTLDWNLTETAAFGPYQGGVVAADSTGVRFLGSDGIEVTLGNLSWPSPVLSRTADRFMLFDKTSHALYFTDGDREYLSLTDDPEARAATLSPGGVALISGEEGYLSVARAYDTQGKLLVEYKTPSLFGVTALLSRDGKTLIFLGVTASETAMESSALVIDIQSAEITASVVFGESLPLGIRELSDGTFTVVFDDGIVAFDMAGSIVGSYDFGTMELDSFSFGDDFTACVLKRRLVGERFAVMTFSADTTVEGQFAESREPVSIAAAGRLVALTFGSVAEVYPASLSTHTDFSFESFIERIALDDKGTVVALTDGTLHVS